MKTTRRRTSHCGVLFGWWCLQWRIRRKKEEGEEGRRKRRRKKNQKKQEACGGNYKLESNNTIANKLKSSKLNAFLVKLIDFYFIIIFLCVKILENLYIMKFIFFHLDKV
jgi:hypothetical protein